MWYGGIMNPIHFPIAADAHTYGFHLAENSYLSKIIPGKCIPGALNSTVARSCANWLHGHCFIFPSSRFQKLTRASQVDTAKIKFLEGFWEIVVCSVGRRKWQLSWTSNGSLYRGGHPIKIVFKDNYKWDSEGIKSRSFLGVGPEHPQVSAHHCWKNNMSTWYRQHH